MFSCPIHSPQTPKELFSLRHAQLRNVIERIFGVLKRRFRLLVSQPEFSYEQQALIVATAAAIHNFIRNHFPINDLDEDDEYDVDGHPLLAGGLTIEAEEVVLAISDEEKARASEKTDIYQQPKDEISVAHDMPNP